MIHDQDRSGWFGASDTVMVMGRWDTETFRRWWLVKLGLRRDHYTNLAMQTGTALEHRILEQIGTKRMDRQIKNRRLRLRVNLDGETRDTIQEIKTYGGITFKLTRAYWMQTQVEMFAARKPCIVIAYRLEPEDYRNWFRPIDPSRLSAHRVAYDGDWVQAQYLPRLRYLAACLRKGEWPDETGFRVFGGRQADSGDA